MLLPSDVARLVLGYLQEEGLCATSQTFIHESPNLKEYADHTTEDGTIPACVFSIFGKGLTTILNDYVAAKTKESHPEVPVMMTSLWKKLDLTLNQIKSMQNSPALSANQRTRTRMGLANMARQRVLTVASAGGVVCSTVSETISSISPTHTSFSTISHSTPVSYTTPHSRLALGSVTHQQISDGDRILNIPRDSPVNIVVAEHRLNPGPMSPGRRKWDTPRKRSAAVGGSSSVGRSAAAVSSLTAEPQPEEVIDENFPQLVIQNACDKILGDRSLQEKLAENINKILANEPTPQTLKPLSATVEPDQSIDEILGLQGEIHMSDDAIHDILEQTESDPAFQALFDLFDCNKGKFPHGEPGDGDVSNNPEESDAAGSSSTVELLQNNNPDTTQRDSTVSETTAATMKTRVGQDRKTRRSAAPTLLKKTFIPSSGRTSRIEGSSARLLVSQGEHQAAPSAAVNTDSKEGTSLFSDSISVTPMDIDEPLNTPPPPLDFVATSAPATKDNASTTTSLCESTKVPSSGASSAIYAPVVTAASIVDKNHEGKQASTDQPAAAHSIAPSSQPALLSLLQIEPNNTPRLTPDLSDMPVSAGEGNTPQVSAHTATAESCSSISVSSRFTVTAVPSLPPASTTTPFTATAGSQICSPASTALTPASFMPVSPASFFSCAPAAVAPAPPPTDLSTPSKAAADSSNMVSLKIIISDSQDEEAPNDMALNQAVSSISGDKIPTIYLSSPAKSPGMLPCPSTPKGNLDEVAQAVSGLQNSEVFASPLTRKTGALVASPLTGTSQAQQSYIIQVPLSTTNPVIQGATASYFLVTEPPAAETPTRQVLLPASVSPAQPLPTSQFGGITPTQGYSSGSTLILPSSVKPVMLPVSVMGQNSLGNVQMVSNQLVAIPNPVSVQQPEAVKPKQSTVPIKQSKTAGTEENLLSAENTSQQDAEKGSSHRRILCFDSSADVQPQSPKTTQTSTPLSTNTSTSVTVQQPETDNIGPSPRTKPAILGGNKPKRRIAIIRCPANPQSKGGLVKEADTFVTAQKQHKEMIKKNPRKQLHNTNNKESQSASISIVDSSKPETSKKLEVRRRSKSVDRKHSLGDDKTKAKTADIHSSKPSCSDSVPKSGTKNDKEESSREESAEKAPAKIICEGRTEKKTQEVPNVTANKENENKGSTQQHSTPTSPTSRDVSPPDISQPISSPQSKMTKAPSKTSSLVKQAAEMLQDIQGLNSPSTPVKGPGASTPEPSLPRTPGTGTNQEQLTDCSRTPSRQKGKDGEETPRRIILPNTPDVPTCSPASEAGSENSINMAAHTLMILSRAAIARSGTPLKDSLRQEGAGEKSPSSSKNSKKRKQSPPSDSQPAKKESKPSPNRKKDREKKRLVDCFPHDLDVDKFLSSLHYDE